MDLLANAAATILGTENAPAIFPPSRPKRKRVDENFLPHTRAVIPKIEGIKYSSRLQRRWCKLEFFYSSIDQEFFEDNEFVTCLSQINLGNVTTLTKSQWRVVRAIMGSDIGRPRRFSQAFLEGELFKLEEYRQSVRQLNKTNPQTTKKSTLISVGSKVEALGYQRQVNTGVVLSIVSPQDTAESANYLVQFDNSDVESSFYTDTEIRLLPQSGVDGGVVNLKSLGQSNQLQKSLSSGSRTGSYGKHSFNNGLNLPNLDDEETGWPEKRFDRQLSQMSQMSQLSQQSMYSTTNFTQTDLITNEDSQISDVTFFKLPARKLALLDCRSAIDEAFSAAEKQAEMVLDRCVSNSLQWVAEFSNLKSHHPRLYGLLIRCLESLIVLQFFPAVDKNRVDLDSIVLALAVRICEDDMHVVDPTQLHSLLDQLTSIVGAVSVLMETNT